MAGKVLNKSFSASVFFCQQCQMHASCFCTGFACLGSDQKPPTRLASADRPALLDPPGHDKQPMSLSVEPCDSSQQQQEQQMHPGADGTQNPTHARDGSSTVQQQQPDLWQVAQLESPLFSQASMLEEDLQAYAALVHDLQAHSPVRSRYWPTRYSSNGGWMHVLVESIWHWPAQLVFMFCI